MIVRRLAALALAGPALAVALLPAAPALAHGAPTSPISRSAACAAGGGLKTGTAACQAALKANGGPFGTFDNVRVPDVDGNDRKVVPDGRLCSGGLDAFKGLDIARDDFPATTVTGGRTLTVKYRATLPHQGSFRVYLTGPGYDPTKKLTWDDLGGKPLTEVANPPLTDGSYVFGVKLPQRTGRQMLYVVWQTTSTPDTYYSCSDLVFTAAATEAAPAATKAPRKVPPSSPAAAIPDPAGTDSAVPDAADHPVADPQRLTPLSDKRKVTLGHRIIVGAVLLGIGALAVGGFGRIRRKRFENR